MIVSVPCSAVASRGNTLYRFGSKRIRNCFELVPGDK